MPSALAKPTSSTPAPHASNIRLAGHAQANRSTTTWKPASACSERAADSERTRSVRLRGAPVVRHHCRQRADADHRAASQGIAARRFGAAVPRGLRRLFVRVHTGFSANVLSMVDRGFVYAIAHVRGGLEKGQRWHDAGRRENKLNTFTDFIAVAEHLIKSRLHHAGTHRRARRFRRRLADGRGRQHAARSLCRHRRARAVRRRAQHDARRNPAA